VPISFLRDILPLISRQAITASSPDCLPASTSQQDSQAASVSPPAEALADLGAHAGFWDWDLTTDKVYFSLAWAAMLGWDVDELQPTSSQWFELVHPNDLARVKALVAEAVERPGPSIASEHRMLHKDGSYRWVLIRAYVQCDSTGAPRRLIGSQADVSDRKFLERILLHDIAYDTVTRLPQRAIFEARLDRSLARVRRCAEYLFAVFFLDLDRFKAVNDALGHRHGDQLLRSVAERLQGCLRPQDLIARYGGDEFVILIDNIRTEQDAYGIADRIQQQMRCGYQLADRVLTVGASLGIAFSQASDSRDALLHRADMSMFQAKACGGSTYAVAAR